MTAEADTLKAQLLHQPPFEDEMIVFSGIMFIDPGTVGTGMAFWNHLSTQPPLGSAGKCNPYTTAHWIPPKSMPWRERSDKIVHDLLMVAGHLRPNIIVIEEPWVWGSPRSVAAALRGDLLKLVYLVGRIEEGCRQWLASMGIELAVIFVKPQEWKGTMKKEAVALRIKRATGEVYEEHAEDAVGMGLSAQGIL